MTLRVVGAMAAIASMAFAGDVMQDVSHRLNTSADVFQEIMHTPDKGIPTDLLQKAQCVGIVPDVVRAGFIVGGKYGKGFVVCRTGNGHWSAPDPIRIEGGSVGLQIGAGATDLVFIVMNRRGMRHLLQDKFTIGGGAAVMAGPVGRSGEAMTDAEMHAEILSYSRARGVFAGISLQGATLRPDHDDIDAMYGHRVSPRAILMGEVQRPQVARPLYEALNRYAPARTAHR
jgi:SH3 domain-containing YSC84-like protein 1